MQVDKKMVMYVTMMKHTSIGTKMMNLDIYQLLH